MQKEIRYYPKQYHLVFKQLAFKPLPSKGSQPKPDLDFRVYYWKWLLTTHHHIFRLSTQGGSRNTHHTHRIGNQFKSLCDESSDYQRFSENSVYT